MTYFSVLVCFILPPVLLLLINVPKDIWPWLRERNTRVSWRPYLILVAHIFLALAYTSPWDNYLVATAVWWYDPDLVTGYTIGWVPLEEYIFFVLQTALTGLWALYISNRFSSRNVNFIPDPRPRVVSAFLIVTLWLVAAGVLLFAWKPGTYLALILTWALLPVLVQLSFGADILFERLPTLALTILPPTIYLWVVDYIAIQSGTWTIDPHQTTGIKLGVLPVEEMLFFLMTNLIIGFGMNLMLATESQKRVRDWMADQRSNAHEPKSDSPEHPLVRDQLGRGRN